MFRDESDRLRSPACWCEKELNDASPSAVRLRHMLRARPDLLVITTGRAIWVELKVESGIPAKRGDGYQQLETQGYIAEVAQTAVPALRERRPLNLLIQREPSQVAMHLTWQQIVGDDCGYDILKPGAGTGDAACCQSPSLTGACGWPADLP